MNNYEYELLNQQNYDGFCTNLESLMDQKLKEDINELNPKEIEILNSISNKTYKLTDTVRKIEKNDFFIIKKGVIGNYIKEDDEGLFKFALDLIWKKTTLNGPYLSSYILSKMKLSSYNIETIEKAYQYNYFTFEKSAILKYYKLINKPPFNLYNTLIGMPNDSGNVNILTRDPLLINYEYINDFNQNNIFNNKNHLKNFINNTSISKVLTSKNSFSKDKMDKILKNIKENSTFFYDMNNVIHMIDEINLIVSSYSDLSLVIAYILENFKDLEDYEYYNFVWGLITLSSKIPSFIVGLSFSYIFSNSDYFIELKPFLNYLLNQNNICLLALHGLQGTSEFNKSVKEVICKPLLNNEKRLEILKTFDYRKISNIRFIVKHYDLLLIIRNGLEIYDLIFKMTASNKKILNSPEFIQLKIYYYAQYILQADFNKMTKKIIEEIYNFYQTYRDDETLDFAFFDSLILDFSKKDPKFEEFKPLKELVIAHYDYDKMYNYLLKYLERDYPSEKVYFSLCYGNSIDFNQTLANKFKNIADVIKLTSYLQNNPTRNNREIWNYLVSRLNLSDLGENQFESYDKGGTMTSENEFLLMILLSGFEEAESFYPNVIMPCIEANSPLIRKKAISLLTRTQFEDETVNNIVFQSLDHHYYKETESDIIKLLQGYLNKKKIMVC